MAEDRDFRKREPLEKYTVKMLYGQNDGRFEKEYLKMLERKFDKKQKLVSLEKKP